ncbi:amidohydrolase [Actinoalloteichus sp. AHMU CJ021]|uniref:amidohydrolase family protein n=1 Tax=Actinoalloteichus sp. AHMU CJ021 TaxID=2072503 RepID=UPI000CA07E18|nr:amidohydrolase [Actinoalloteichus sp. AHMU CJ021]
MGTLIRHASVITMDEVTGARPITTSIRISDDLISEIGPDLEPRPDERVIDGRDRLVTPGLVNGHLHSWEALFKGRYDNLPLELWMLFSYPILGIGELPADLVRLRTLLVAMESLRAGVTCVVDDVLETPTQNVDQLAAVFDAYELAGIRANVSGHVINKPFVDTLPFVEEVLRPDLLDEVRAITPPRTDEYLDFSRRAFERHHERAGGRLRYMVAPSGPQRCTDDLLVGAAELARAWNAEYHIHVLETKVQAVTGREFHGTTLVEHLRRIGALGRETTLAHGIWLTRSDIEILGAANASVSHNPISNLKLGSGIAPFRDLLDAGVNLALGSDGASSSDSPRMLDVVKAAGLLHKVSEPDHHRWPSVAEVLRAGTLGGARSALVEDRTGSLEVGKQADLVIYDLNTLSFTPRNDLAVHLVYSENGSSIEQVMVAGETVVENGRLTRVDEDAVLAELRHWLPRVREWQEEWESVNAAFVPAFTEIHRRCAATPTGVNRWSGDEEAWLIG